MNKIIVIGSPGAGKSTLSKKLAKALNIPLYHLDNLFWNKDKTHIEYPLFEDKIRKIMETDKWIIDGNYADSLEMRIKETDTIILLNYDLDICLNGIKERVGILRDDIPWKEDTLDPEFYQFVLNFPTVTLIKIKKILANYPNKNLIEFKNREEANNFVKNIK